MKGYGQFCPVAKAAEVIGERWTPLVLRELICGSRRFNEIHRGVPLMSPSLLSQRLKALEQAGIVERRTAGKGGSEYVLTPAGTELRPLIEMLGVWGQRWVQSQLTDQDLDAGLLMWDISRRIRLDRMPNNRTVIQFTFTDGPKGKRLWWLVGNREGIDLCLTDPGFEVDLFVSTDVRTLTRVWLGHVSLARALDDGALDLHGPQRLRDAFPTWLRLGVFAAVGAAGGYAPA